MLTIRKEQMAAFEALSGKQFRAKLDMHARSDYPQEVEAMEVTAVDSLIDEAINRGKGYGIVTERDVSLFFDLFFLLEPGFDSKPKNIWMRKILLNEEMDGSEKMEALYKRLAALENRASSADKGNS